MSDYISPELEKKLETIEKHSAYLEGYSDGLWSMWQGTQLALMIFLILIGLSWLATVIYTFVRGC